MALTLSANQQTTLASHHQRVKCHFVGFTTWNPSNVYEFTAGAYTFQDKLQIYPRYSWTAANASITVYGDQSIQRGGAAATGHAWTLAGSGSIATDGDECTYTAPSVGSGTVTIKLTSDGNAVGTWARVAYGTARLNAAEIMSYHSDITTGGWEIIVKARGDCTGFDREKGILLVVDELWNGSSDVFGGYRWSKGVFFGYVDRVRTIHQDADDAYLEVKLVSPWTLLNYAQLCDLFFSKTDDTDGIQIADFLVIDAVWWVMRYSEFAQWHNCWIYTDTNSVANLKISQGPMADVLTDIAARTFSIIYSTNVGDLIVAPDPDIRGADNYWTGATPFNDDVRWTIDEDKYHTIDIYSEDVDNPENDPPDPPDPTIGQVRLTAIKSDLTEITQRHPDKAAIDAGHSAELGGLICEDQATLNNWVVQYWYKVQPEIRADIYTFLLHQVDLYMFLTWSPTIRAALSNHGLASPSENCYVTGADFDVNPAMGTWQGCVHVQSQAAQP